MKDSGGIERKPLVGLITLLVIFAALCLTILSILSFSTAKYEKNLAQKNADAAETLKATGVRVLTQAVNVADEAAVAAGMAEAVAKMGRVDTVVANAGIGAGAKSFSEFPTETYRKVL